MEREGGHRRDGGIKEGENGLALICGAGPSRERMRERQTNREIKREGIVG